MRRSRWVARDDMNRAQSKRWYVYRGWKITEQSPWQYEVKNESRRKYSTVEAYLQYLTEATDAFTRSVEYQEVEKEDTIRCMYELQAAEDQFRESGWQEALHIDPALTAEAYHGRASAAGVPISAQHIQQLHRIYQTAPESQVEDSHLSRRDGKRRMPHAESSTSQTSEVMDLTSEDTDLMTQRAIALSRMQYARTLGRAGAATAAPVLGRPRNTLNIIDYGLVLQPLCKDHNGVVRSLILMMGGKNDKAWYLGLFRELHEEDMWITRGQYNCMLFYHTAKQPDYKNIQIPERPRVWPDDDPARPKYPPLQWVPDDPQDAQRRWPFPLWLDLDNMYHVRNAASSAVGYRRVGHLTDLEICRFRVLRKMKGGERCYFPLCPEGGQEHYATEVERCPQR